MAQKSQSADSRKQVVELLDKHVAAEIAQDVEAVMDTICPNPRWEIHPPGYVMTTSGAVREFYRRLLHLMSGRSAGKDDSIAAASSEAAAQGACTAVTDGAALRYSVADFSKGAERRVFKSMAILLLDRESGLLKSEFIYLNGAQAQVIKQALGEDFAHYPGVSIEA